MFLVLRPRENGLTRVEVLVRLALPHPLLVRIERVEEPLGLLVSDAFLQVLLDLLPRRRRERR